MLRGKGLLLFCRTFSRVLSSCYGIRILFQIFLKCFNVCYLTTKCFYLCTYLYKSFRSRFSFCLFFSLKYCFFLCFNLLNFFIKFCKSFFCWSCFCFIQSWRKVGRFRNRTDTRLHQKNRSIIFRNLPV